MEVGWQERRKKANKNLDQPTTSDINRKEAEHEPGGRDRGGQGRDGGGGRERGFGVPATIRKSFETTENRSIGHTPGPPLPDGEDGGHGGGGGGDPDHGFLNSDEQNSFTKDDNNPGLLKIVYSNARSIVNKINELNVLCLDLLPNVICLCETWLNDSISNAYVNIDKHV